MPTLSIDRILDLIKKSGKTDKAITLDLELSNSAISEWKKGKAFPKTDAIVKLAQYFDVSVDYLLGLTNTKRPDKQEVSEQAMRVAELFDSLDEKSKAKAEGFLEALADHNKS